MTTLTVILLMAGLTGLLGAVGSVLGGQSGMVIALLLAAGMNLFAYFASAQMVLRMYGAQVVDANQAPQLYAMVDRLRQRAGLPMPVVAVAPHLQPNAFATGRDPEHAVVCVTEGLLRAVSEDELEGVVAHELAHIKNRDMLLMTVTATLAGAISNVAQFGFFFGGGSRDDRQGVHPFVMLAMLLLAPLAAMMVQLAISRQREFKADAVGAWISGKPRALANALRRLDDAAHRIPMDVAPAVAPLAQVNPLAARGGAMMKLFSTHPPMDERIARLEALAANPAAAGIA